MTRLPDILGLYLVTLVLGVLSSCRDRVEAGAPGRALVPKASVVLITLDTTRADHLSCYASDTLRPGTQFAQTPHLDALAGQGVRFEHATAQVPLTLPSHACIFTGTYPEVHGLRDMGGFTLNPNVQTLAMLAHRLGLLTAAFVGSKTVGRRYGLAHGFDLYDDAMPVVPPRQQSPSTIAERRAGVTTDHALAWLRQHSHERFFLWVHYYDPHFPYDPPEPYHSSYIHDPYSGEIAYTDEQAGRILGFLGRNNLRSRTLVVVTADHGEGLFQHGEGEHGVFLYDDTLHVPLIISGPGVPVGGTITQQVRSIDILPTVVEFLGVASGPTVQGTSLWPLMKRGRELPGKGSDFAYLESILPKTRMNWSELRGMRADHWKFILAPHPELYDLEHDPGETHNVIAQHPAEATELQRKMWEVVGPPGRVETLTPDALDPQARQELESLGYVRAGTEPHVVLDSSGPDPKDHVASLLAISRYRRLMLAGEYRRAAHTVQGAIPDDSGDPALRIYLAKAYERRHDWADLVRACRAAERAGVVTGPIYAFEGEALMRETRLTEAVAAMKQGRLLDPRNIDNLYNLGTAYLYLRRPAPAEENFQAMLAQASNASAAYEGLGLAAVERDELGAAMQDFQKAAAADPNNPNPLLDLGVLCQNTGNRALALHYLGLFLQKAPPGVYGSLIPRVQREIRQLRAASDGG